ncbi:queuosine precursor transporter [Advenella alkanexedens]|uniref:Probable queuosine precursor transporter n=1 Tax=Advenella alkanexedens TaxID=1481665 RepID=A0ABS6NNY5_9BURK|nr:queuosine precursor transporter [Advenella alkanexedens]MBV4397348.1 queuosine precursor transporter [Advenella alkanexedens]
MSKNGYFDQISSLQALLSIVLMCIIVVASNVLVQPQFHINEWLTWGALTYPVSFLVTDLLNRRFGPQVARKIVLVGFVAAIIVSYLLADARIAIASGSAFLFAQLGDIFIFDKMRQLSWWKAPFIAGALASVIDTFLFFGLAFAGTPVPWISLALGDMVVKLLVSMCLLLPFRMLMWNIGKPKNCTI